MPTMRIPYGVLDGRYVNSAGDAITGQLTISRDPSLGTQLRLSNATGNRYADFQTDNNGDLNIATSGNDVKLPNSLLTISGPHRSNYGHLCINGTTGNHSYQTIYYNNIFMGWYGLVSNNFGLCMYNGGSGGNLIFYTKANQGESARFDVNGKFGIGTTNPGGLIGLANPNTYIDVDDSGNLIFADANTGVRTLNNLGCPNHIFIKATSLSEGDIHLSDNINWGVSKALIKIIRVITSSTDWDLYILQNDNGHEANDANVPEMQIMESGNGDANIYLDLPYEDEDVSNEVHLHYVDKSGLNTADIYIFGYEMI